jgi:hypothetical protein
VGERPSSGRVLRRRMRGILTPSRWARWAHTSGSPIKARIGSRHSPAVGFELELARPAVGRDDAPNHGSHGNGAGRFAAHHTCRTDTKRLRRREAPNPCSPFKEFPHANDGIEAGNASGTLSNNATSKEHVPTPPAIGCRWRAILSMSNSVRGSTIGVAFG